MVINERFPVLSTIAKVLWISGILSCVLGVIAGLFELLEFAKFLGKTGAEWYWGKEDLLKICTFILGSMAGLWIMAIAESIGVLFAIEKNTRK